MHPKCKVRDLLPLFPLPGMLPMQAFRDSLIPETSSAQNMSGLPCAAESAAADVSFLHGKAVRKWPSRMPICGRLWTLQALKQNWRLPY